MHNLILDEVPYSVDDVEEEINLGLEGDGGAAEFNKSVQRLAVDHLHQEAIVEVLRLLGAVIFRKEVGDASS